MKKPTTELKLKWLIEAIFSTEKRFLAIETDVLGLIALPPKSHRPDITQAKLESRRQTIKHTLISLQWLLGKDRPWMKSKEEDQEENLRMENHRLKEAIQATLKENAHLADGDNCTLIRLKRALE